MPPSTPAKPAGVRPKFSAPYNYIPPGGSTTPSTKPSYPTVSPNYTASRSLWQPPGADKPAPPVVNPPNLAQPFPVKPPASFSPPASPSFSAWGPRPSEPERPADPGSATSPEATGTAGADERQQPPADLAGNEQAPGQTFDFDLASAIGNGNGFATHEDPVLPEFIDLSMFRDPDAPDEEAEQEPEVGLEGGEAAWTSSEAWPSPMGEPSDPGRRSSTSQGEDTVFMEPPWLAEEPGRPAPDPSGTDWTSPDTPWPGETRRPAELPSWADEPAATPGRPGNREWAEDPWAASREPVEKVAPPVDPLPEPWPEPAPGPVATGPMSEFGPEGDLWGKPRRFGRKRQERQQRAQPETSVRNDAGQASPPPDQRRRGRRVQPEEQYPAEDPWRQAQARNGAPAAEPDAAWGRPQPPQSDPWGQPAAPPDEESLRERPRRRTEDTWVHQVAQETSYYEQPPVAEVRSPEPRPERPRRVAQPAPDDPWARQHEEAQAARAPEPQRVEQQPASARARENAELDAWARAHADVDEEDFKPRVFDLQLGDEEPDLPEPARRIATRLKIDPTAIKVESGLAYVLVDDEGRPVRS